MWDSLLWEGFSVIHRVILAICKVLEEDILKEKSSQEIFIALNDTKLKFEKLYNQPNISSANIVC